MLRPRHRASPKAKPISLRLTSYRPHEGTAGPRQDGMVHHAPGGFKPIIRRARPARIPAGHPAVGLLSASVSADRLLLTLPVPPSINHQYATVNGRRVLSAIGKGYKTLVAQQTLVALAGSPCSDRLLKTLRAGYLTLSIRFHFASPLRRDVDGGLKIAQDALCEALGINDNRVVEIHLYKAQDAALPRIEASLRLAALP
ncbi:MAG: RusA family crossover junction endodeoxyribonuclease [Nitrospiraceae bacterium]